jgi:LuxR family maltose regulon positive regulatory protein
MGDTASSLVALRRALALARPQDVKRAFLTEGDGILQLLQLGRTEWDSADLIEFTDRLLEIAGKSTMMGPPATQDLVEPLSPREIEVLRLLPTGLTAEELAKELFISVNTVRTHMKNLYSKLGVHSRHEAVVRASELDLL